MSAASPLPGARERKKAEKRERLRRAAWELFVKVGYERTTTRAIARRARVAEGTVFLYAKDKADLLFLVFEGRLAETLAEATRTLPEAPLVEQLLHVFGTLLAMYERSPDVARHFVKELPGSDGPNALRVNALTFEFLGRLAALVEAARCRGEIREDVSPPLAAQSAFALYFMAIFTWLGGIMPLGAVRDAYLRPALELLQRGMAPSAPPAPPPPPAAR